VSNDPLQIRPDMECRQNPEEKEVVDERCYCGHLKSEHRDRVIYGRLADGRALEPNEGSCMKCECPRFAWFGWVFSDGSES